MSDGSIYKEPSDLWVGGSGNESDEIIVPPTPPRGEITRLPSSYSGPELSQIISTDEDEEPEDEDMANDSLQANELSDLDEQEDENDQQQQQQDSEDDDELIESQEEEIQSEKSEDEVEKENLIHEAFDDSENDVSDLEDYADDVEKDVQEDFEEFDENSVDLHVQKDSPNENHDPDQEDEQHLEDDNQQEYESNEIEVVESSQEEELLVDTADEAAGDVETEHLEQTNDNSREESASAEGNLSEQEEEFAIISSDENEEEAGFEPQYEDSGSEYVDEDEDNGEQNVEIQNESPKQPNNNVDEFDDEEHKAFHYASTPASRYAFKRPAKEAQRIINYLDTTHADDLSTHLYSTHLLHRINPEQPQAIWASWPTRHAVHTPTIDMPTHPRPADLARQDLERKLDAQLRGNSNSSKHNGAGGDNDEGFVRRLPRFDPSVASVTGNLTANDQWVRYPLAEYKSSKVLGNVLGHSGGTKYTSTTGRPEEMPYNTVSQGIPPFDYTRYRRVAEPMSEEDRLAFEHARKLVMFEVSSTFERIVRQRIEEETKQQAQLDDELGVPPQKRRRLVVNSDLDFKMPQQALARVMETVDRLLMNTVAIQHKSNNYKAEDWIGVIQHDAAVGSVFARCKKLFMDDVDDPRDPDSEDDEEEKEKQQHRKRKIKIEDGKEEEQKWYPMKEQKVISARLNFKTLNRVNNLSLAVPPDSFVRPEITSFEPDMHAANGLNYRKFNLMQTSINPIYTYGLPSMTKLKPHKTLPEYQPDDMRFYNSIDNAAKWRATPHARRLEFAYRNLERYAQPLDGYSGGGPGRMYDQNWILDEYIPEVTSRPVYDMHVNYTQVAADRQRARTAVLRHARALRRVRQGSRRSFLKQAGVSGLYRKWKRKCDKRRRRQLRALRKQWKRECAAAEAEGRTPPPREFEDENDNHHDEGVDTKLGADITGESSDDEIPQLVQALNAEVFQKMAVSARTPVMAPRRYLSKQLGLW
ncbi:hypothetical protein D0Z00_001282 [Geotrichum galactomycetum]|uniref:Uncharacterized protein n=1 Tax=Geotrichum galactomycetum TaxID=27317 RepID=A0ACB6V7G9_9ASCO|nr:hypothetical protein D0Z00_001282 [Geotrichum candidum]